jgi:hypothetical protein
MGKCITLDDGVGIFGFEFAGGHRFAQRHLNGRPDEIDAGVERNFAGAEKAAGQTRRQFDDMRLPLVDDDVAFHRAVDDAEGGSGAADDILHLRLNVIRQMAGKIAAIFDEEGRIAFQIFVIAI